MSVPIVDPRATEDPRTMDLSKSDRYHIIGALNISHDLKKEMRDSCQEQADWDTYNEDMREIKILIARIRGNIL